MVVRRWCVALVLTLVGMASAWAGEFTGRVIGVSDGDTIPVLREGRETRVRLHGIDCPEKTQAFGQRAKEFTSSLAFGQTVLVSVVDIDRYGRIVGQVTLADGRNLNQALVEAGLAWWYRNYAPGDRELEALERQARAARRGLWADARPVEPWVFRKKPRGG